MARAEVAKATRIPANDARLPQSARLTGMNSEATNAKTHSVIAKTPPQCAGEEIAAPLFERLAHRGKLKAAPLASGKASLLTPDRIGSSMGRPLLTPVSNCDQPGSPFEATASESTTTSPAPRA